MTTDHEFGVTNRFTRNASNRTVPVRYKRPECFALYYRYRHAVDDSNNLRQNSDAIEIMWQTEQWVHRSFAFMLGVCEANAFNAYRFFSTDPEPLTHLDFRRAICAKLLVTPVRRQATGTPGAFVNGHAHQKFMKGRKWKNGRFVPYPKNRNARGEIQKRCVRCEVYKKVTHHCECDGSQGLCNDHWREHLLEVAHGIASGM